MLYFVGSSSYQFVFSASSAVAGDHYILLYLFYIFYNLCILLRIIVPGRRTGETGSLHSWSIIRKLWIKEVKTLKFDLSNKNDKWLGVELGLCSESMDSSSLAELVKYSKDSRPCQMYCMHWRHRNAKPIVHFLM